MTSYLRWVSFIQSFFYQIWTIKKCKRLYKSHVLPPRVKCPRCWTCGCVSCLLERGFHCWSFLVACWSSLRPRWVEKPKGKACSTTITSTKRMDWSFTAPSSRCVRKNWWLLLERRGGNQRSLWDMEHMDRDRCFSWTLMDHTHISWTFDMFCFTRLTEMVLVCEVHGNVNLVWS